MLQTFSCALYVYTLCPHTNIQIPRDITHNSQSTKLLRNQTRTKRRAASIELCYFRWMQQRNNSMIVHEISTTNYRFSLVLKTRENIEITSLTLKKRKQNYIPVGKNNQQWKFHSYLSTDLIPRRLQKICMTTTYNLLEIIQR